MMLGDYYPLTPYSRRSDEWIAWQFNRPKHGDGCVQVFRRAECADATIWLRLNDLDAAANYELKDFDAAASTVASGRRLMKEGLSVVIQSQPGAAIITYRVVPRRTTR